MNQDQEASRPIDALDFSRYSKIQWPDYTNIRDNNGICVMMHNLDYWAHKW